MTDRAAEHQMTDVAALYALGALSQHEARSFEQHLEEGCEECGAELESFAQTVRALAFSTSDEQPPARVRSELLARLDNPGAGHSGVSTESSEAKRIFSVLASDGGWQELENGILFKPLHLDKKTGIATSLVRMPPGAALPVHQHLGVEQFFIIEGDCIVDGQRLGAGDYHRAEAGTIHETTYTVGGTLFLLIAPERYDVLEAR